MDSISAHNSARIAFEVPGCRRKGTVVAVDSMGSMSRLRVRVPGWPKARPGQFALLQAEDSACFLARALSVSEQCDDNISFLIAPVGAGTRELVELAQGSAVWVLGPLGNGFDLDEVLAHGGRLLVVGGGVGIAPFPLLLTSLAAEQARRAGISPEVLALVGYRDQAQALGGKVLVEALAGAGVLGLACGYERVLEDGSEGRAARVTDLLARHLASGDAVLVCGPEAMARAVWQLCSIVPEVRAWFSLEAGMACGVGSCHGCVIELADGSYARVCREGPVFAGEEVFGG